MTPATEGHPRHHVEKMRARLQETMRHLRDDVTKVDEPQFMAMRSTAVGLFAG
jgi:hypothetical protein